MVADRLIEMGAIVASDVVELSEGSPPETKRGAAHLASIEYVMISGKSRHREINRAKDPTCLVMVEHKYGGWAVLPYDRIGDATMILLPVLREMSGEQKADIQVQPITHEEIANLWPSRGGD